MRIHQVFELFNFLTFKMYNQFLAEQKDLIIKEKRLGYCINDKTTYFKPMLLPIGTS